MKEDFRIRQGTLDDVETVVAHRRAMFREMGYRDGAALDKMCEAFQPWLERRMRHAEYLAWFAVAEDGKIAAGLGLWLMAAAHDRTRRAARKHFECVHAAGKPPQGAGSEADGCRTGVVLAKPGSRGDPARER